MAEQDDIFGAIGALNLTYLGLLQQMLQIDPEVAARELGISNQIASWIIELTPDQIEELENRSEPLRELHDEVVPRRA